ncbi:MAG: metal-dependent transcriptional regulator [Synergistetes bacterium]|nr:metal-dependent transcriptional regulator [Synergistota bacterium]MCX8128318.1 metal-dependent transcriptional regulator [Synergistota bacterium]MDW8192637.1 metal-dependent transcriptional regulator [Synergistota bacterium]
MFTLTPALEDYLEGILTLKEEKGVVRVKDLASLLKVKASSAVESLKKLKEMKLIEQEKYGYIELTQAGINIAKAIKDRHTMLKRFLINILKVREEIAESDACKMEHFLSNETLEKLISFVSSFEAEKNLENQIDTPLKSLNELNIGSKARIIKIIAAGSLKRRLLDMGFIKGEELEVKNVAPLGDPIEILIKGTNVSLRKEEAEKILVEVISG